MLSYIPWRCSFLDDNIDNNWVAWTDLFFTAVDEHIPNKRLNCMKNSPWITKELLELCKRKRSLYKKAKRLDKSVHWDAHRKFNNFLKKACNSATQEYITDLAKELNENLNPKPFWDYVKSKRKGTNILTSQQVDGTTFTDDLSIAESMNQFFSSVFRSENLDNLPEFDYACDQKLSDIQCSINEMENQLKDFDTVYINLLGLTLYHPEF